MILKIFDRFKVRQVSNFTNFQLSLSYDSFGSTFSFEFLFDPNNPDHKELACVSHFHECTIEHNDEVLVKGFALSQGFKWSSQKNLASISGYSLPGIFEDVNIPPDLYPLQYNGMSLLSIVNKVTSKWNTSTKYKIGVVVDDVVKNIVNKAYNEVTAQPTETIANFLKGLAQQKDVIISHDENGNILLTKAKTESKPILTFDFEKGQIPGVSFDLSFNGQSFHSHITVMKQAGINSENAGQYTIKNPYCPVTYRPKVVNQSSGDEVDSSSFAMRELKKELEGLTLTIQLDRWIINGKIIKPNQMIEINSPELYIYGMKRFFIRSVDFTGSAVGTTCVLNCVLPEVVNNDKVESIYKGINMHP